MTPEERAQIYWEDGLEYGWIESPQYMLKQCIKRMADAIREHGEQKAAAARNAALEEAAEKMDEVGAIYITSVPAAPDLGYPEGAEIETDHEAADIIRAIKDTPPGHTDLMVTPESLDEWLEDNPPPAPTEPVDWAERLAETVRELLVESAPITQSRKLTEAQETLTAYKEAKGND